MVHRFKSNDSTFWHDLTCSLNFTPSDSSVGIFNDMISGPKDVSFIYECLFNCFPVCEPHIGS